MRAWLLVGLIPLVAACSTATKPAHAITPSAALRHTDPHDFSGRWTGTWVGTGMFNSPREDDVTFILSQDGNVAYGRLMFDGTVAAESVPVEIRRQGLSGVRVVARVSGSRIRVRHELGSHLFAADFRVVGDQMIGDVRGSSTGMRLVLTRASRPAAPAVARVVPAAPEPVAPPVTPVPELPPIANQAPAEPSEPTTRDIAVVTPAPQPELPSERPREEEFVAVPELTAIHFDFDKSALRPDAQDGAATNALWLKEHEDQLVLIEGHCDERGTPEYNLALGERRAKAVMEDLEAHGVAADRISTITYGKERPVCTEDTEECRGLNRRAEFRIKPR